MAMSSHSQSRSHIPTHQMLVGHSSSSTSTSPARGIFRVSPNNHFLDALMDIAAQSDAALPVILEDGYTELLESFRQNGIITLEMLMSSPADLARKTGRPLAEVEEFVKKYKEQSAERIKATKVTRFEEDEMPCFTTGDIGIDSCLNGGIPRGYLIEVSGAAATGKSNILTSLAVTIQLPVELGGLGESIFNKSQRGVKTLYLDTESAMSTKRLEEMISYWQKHLEANGIKDKCHWPQMSNVIIPSTSINSLETQDFYLYYRLPALLEKHSGEIKLVVLDSITNHVRSELKFWDRDVYIMKVCRYLKKLSMDYGVTVMVINQMTDKPLTGIFSSRNSLLYKMNFDYQSGWWSGWDDAGIVYRQLLQKRKKKNWKIDTYDEIGYPEQEDTADSTIIGAQLLSEQKRLFQSDYRSMLGRIKSIPALGLPLLNFIDARILLRKENVPILNEKLIDELSLDLGIVTSTQTDPGTADTDPPATKKPSFADTLSKNEYLANHNFETQRWMKVVFSPLIASGQKECLFEIWKGGIRSK